MEKLDVNHSQRFEADLIAKYEIYSYIHFYIYNFISQVSVNQKLSFDVLYDLFGILFSALYFKSRVFFHMISDQTGISFLSI